MPGVACALESSGWHWLTVKSHLPCGPGAGIVPPTGTAACVLTFWADMLQIDPSRVGSQPVGRCGGAEQASDPQNKADAIPLSRK